MTLDERIRLYIGDIVVQLNAAQVEIEQLKAQVTELQGIHKESVHVPKQEKGRKANAQAQAPDSAAIAQIS